MKTIIQISMLTVINFVLAQNIQVGGDYGGRHCEPSIMLDPNAPNKMVAGSVTDGFYYSEDSGKTWRNGTLKSSLGVWGDPVIDVDSKGNFYYFHLSNPPSGSWIDRIVCQKSTDGGKTWTDGVGIGKDGKKAQDKHWSVIDRTNDNIYLTWTQFDKYDSNSPSHKTIIRFSRSTDGGATWSEPIKINTVDGSCKDGDNAVEGATPAVGPNGEVYVAWAGPNGLVFNKSTDQGKTWLKNEKKIGDMPGGWAFDIPGLQRCNGMPIIKCDLSNGPNRGTLYVNWSDQRNGENDTDIWLATSRDGGETWSEPKRVNDDGKGSHQFFTWMDIDQTNGNLYFVFYDRRNHTDKNTDVYLATSEDGGETFKNIKISESPFKPTSAVFFGDYNNIVAHNGIIRPIWTRLDGSHYSIWTDITPNLSAKKEKNNNLASNEVKQYPNPSSSVSYIAYKIKRNAKEVSLELFDTKGKKVHTIINKEEKPYGRYIETINLDKLNLPTGTYFCKLTINNNSKTLRTIVISED